jgi:hypothetical protein
VISARSHATTVLGPHVPPKTVTLGTMNQKTPKTRPFLSIPTAAAQLGVDVSRLRDAVRRKQVYAVVIGSQALIPAKEIERLVGESA